jgi:hypothetical protein
VEAVVTFHLFVQSMPRLTLWVGALDRPEEPAQGSLSSLTIYVYSCQIHGGIHILVTDKLARPGTPDNIPM